jgi:hypothetical protein
MEAEKSSNTLSRSWRTREAGGVDESESEGLTTWWKFWSLKT